MKIYEVMTSSHDYVVGDVQVHVQVVKEVVKGVGNACFFQTFVSNCQSRGWVAVSRRPEPLSMGRFVVVVAGWEG